MEKLEEFAIDRGRTSGRKNMCKRCDSERSLAYYYERRGPQPAQFCSECEKPLDGRQRVTCGSSNCKEQRFRKLRPESYERREKAKVERRRARRRELRGREDLTAAVSDEAPLENASSPV
jgi:hypothetical protein